MFKKSILILVKIYQKTVSPDSGIFSFWLKTRVCRFYPSCSEYAYEAIDKYGVKKGIVLALKRLLSCHPFNPGGYDPVEEGSSKVKVQS